MANPYKFFHSACEQIQRQIHLILVRPEIDENIGSIVRGAENMGLHGQIVLIGPERKFGPGAKKTAMHARSRLEKICFFPTLQDALDSFHPAPILSMAATVRVGSAHRPHPLQVREAVERGVQKLLQNTLKDLIFVFGPESSGLKNEEVGLCDWVVTIPSLMGYRSLNLAQAAMIFMYEANITLLKKWDTFESVKTSQKDKLIQHVLKVAEASGFVLPKDPFKMRPRLESLFAELPPHIQDARTIHGFLDQIIRTIRKGKVTYKGRYQQTVSQQSEERRN